MTRKIRLSSGKRGIDRTAVRGLSVSLFAAVIAIACGVTGASRARAEDQIVKLVSSQSGKCLQPINGSLQHGDAIVQTTCNGSAAQQWTVHVVSPTAYHLINRASNLCLDARGKAVDGTPIQQWACNGISNEDWGFGITNNILSSGINGAAWTHCIATPGSQDGLPMQLRACSLDPSQIWNRNPGAVAEQSATKPAQLDNASTRVWRKATPMYSEHDCWTDGGTVVVAPDDRCGAAYGHYCKLPNGDARCTENAQ